MDIVFLSEVPVPLAIEVNEASVVTGDFADFLTGSFDLTKNVVLLLEHVASKVNVDLNVILLILVGLSANDLVAKSAHHQAVYLVLCQRVNDFASVWEVYYSLTYVVDVCRLHSSSDLPLHRAIDAIIIVLDRVRGDWRVVRNLLEINLRSVLAHSFVGLTKDRV